MSETTVLTPDQINYPGMRAFLEAYFAAPNGADIEMQVGTFMDATIHAGRLLFATISHPSIGKVSVAMTPDQARGMVTILEESQKRHLDTEDLSSLIRSLRTAVAMIEPN